MLVGTTFDGNRVAITKNEGDQADELAALAASHFNKAERSFTDDMLRRRGQLNANTAGLESGNAEELAQELGFFNADALPDLREELRDTVADGGKITSEVVGGLLPKGSGPAIEVRFDRFNPNAVAFIRSYELDLITRINTPQRAIIRNALDEAIRHGQGPIEWARRIRPQIGLSADLSKAVDSFRTAVESGDSGEIRRLLNRKLRDKRLDGRLRKLANGEEVSKQQIDQMVDRYSERALKYRAERIARTEALRAVHAGQHLTWQQNVQRGNIAEELIRRFWIVTNDDRLRETHAAVPFDNAEGVRLNEGFRTHRGLVPYPPLDPLCRCTVFVRIIEPERGAIPQPVAPPTAEQRFGEGKSDAEITRHESAFANSPNRVLRAIASTRPLRAIVENARSEYQPLEHSIAISRKRTQHQTDAVWRHETAHAVDFDRTPDPQPASAAAAPAVAADRRALTKAFKDKIPLGSSVSAKQLDGLFSEQAPATAIASIDVLKDVGKNSLAVGNLDNFLKAAYSTWDRVSDQADQITALADAVSAVTNTRIGWGHTAKYYRDRKDFYKTPTRGVSGAHTTEAFANYVDLMGDATRLGETLLTLYREFLPNTAKAFDELLEGFE